jgi:hypothetical protein
MTDVREPAPALVFLSDGDTFSEIERAVIVFPTDDELRRINAATGWPGEPQEWELADLVQWAEGNSYFPMTDDTLPVFMQPPNDPENRCHIGYVPQSATEADVGAVAASLAAPYGIEPSFISRVEFREHGPLWMVILSKVGHDSLTEAWYRHQLFSGAKQFFGVQVVDDGR